tara:strand:- start:248 stop:418 length:171 start_codon:yes stop_codon:yes gene_type:complete
MKLRSFNYFLGLLIALAFFTPLNSEEKIDIWKKDKNKVKNQSVENEDTNDDIAPKN